MALVQKRMSRSRLITLSGILIVFLILSGYLVYNNYFAKPDGIVVGPSGDYTSSDLPIVKDLGDSIVNDERYRELEPHGSLPVQIGPYGRSNPFTPPGR